MKFRHLSAALAIAGIQCVGSVTASAQTPIVSGDSLSCRCASGQVVPVGPSHAAGVRACRSLATEPGDAEKCESFSSDAAICSHTCSLLPATPKSTPKTTTGKPGTKPSTKPITPVIATDPASLIEQLDPSGLTGQLMGLVNAFSSGSDDSAAKAEAAAAAEAAEAERVEREEQARAEREEQQRQFEAGKRSVLDQMKGIKPAELQLKSVGATTPAFENAANRATSAGDAIMYREFNPSQAEIAALTESARFTGYDGPVVHTCECGWAIASQQWRAFMDRMSAQATKELADLGGTEGPAPSNLAATSDTAACAQLCPVQRALAQAPSDPNASITWQGILQPHFRELTLSAIQCRYLGPARCSQLAVANSAPSGGAGPGPAPNALPAPAGSTELKFKSIPTGGGGGPPRRSIPAASPTGPAPQDPNERQRAILESGMLPSYAEACSAVARSRDEILLVQAINSAATARLEHSMPKPMAIKLKTADSGPAAGYIPALASDNPRDPRAAKPEEYQAEVMKLLATPPGARGPPAIIVMIVSNRQSIPVLADPTTGKPFTSDADLLAIGRSTSGESILNDPQLGNLTETDKQTIAEWNKRAGQPIAQHGPANLATINVDPKGQFSTVDPSFPVTACDPLGQIKSLGDLQALKNYFNDANARGYSLQPNPGWGWAKADGRY